METVTLNVEPREGTGKERADRLRRSGKVPGVFYGPGQAASSLCIDAREFRIKIANFEGSHLIQLAAPESPLHDKIVLIKEIQRHPVTKNLVHIDFCEIDVNKPLEATVSLHFMGKAQGVTTGGILQPLRRQITVKCLPRDIPDFIEVDVSALAIRDSIHIADLTLPAGVEAVYETNVTLVTVAAPTVVETPAAAAPAEGETPAEGEGEGGTEDEE
jgi:large subunit ribosomal protein L25